MKLLKFEISGFRKLKDKFTIDLVPKGNKSVEDKEYELSEIDFDLFVFNTMGIVGKNASGKSTTVKALEICYDILSNFKIKKTLDIVKNNSNNIDIELFFYENKHLYCYKSKLIYNKENNYVSFNNEELYQTIYYKSYAKDLYNLDKYENMNIKDSNLPEDTSALFLVFKTIKPRGDIYFDKIELLNSIDQIIDLYNSFDKTSSTLNTIISLLDEHIYTIKMENENKFLISYKDNKKEEKNKEELFNMLSSGTIKGLIFYLSVILSLKLGTDFVIDEIENHFHKTLVENIINLYKDKRINKFGATLIFTTHYPELLDLFNRTDNVFVCKYDNNISIKSMFDYKIRNDALKSKKFYENVFNTAVNYEALMDFKRLMLK